MEIAAVLLLGSLASKMTDFLRFLTAGEVRSAMTQGVAWLSGALVVPLFAYSDFGDQIDINGMLLSEFNVFGLIIIGMSASSIFGIVNDGLAAIDLSRTSDKPSLFG